MRHTGTRRRQPYGAGGSFQRVAPAHGERQPPSVARLKAFDLTLEPKESRRYNTGRFGLGCLLSAASWNPASSSRLPEYILCH
jgi:hypothetical protein